MYTMAKCVVLLLAVLGYAMFYQKRRLPLCFFPVTLVSGLTAALYFAGLAGFLKIACYVVLLPGLLALVRYFTLERLKAVFTDQSILFTVFAAIWLFAITRGVMLAHNDDGTHWYRICKAMNYENAYPTTPDIKYYEYVPGCATWIYFITRFMQFEIDNTLFAQSLINIACVASLFSAVSWTKRIREKDVIFVVVIAAGVLLCSIAETTYALLVDVQIGLTAMAALIIGFEMGDSKEGIPLLAIVLAFLALVKNSALLFVAVVFIWICIWHHLSFKECMKRAFAWIAMPVLLNGLYAFRSDLVYGANAISMQGVSVERYAFLFADKSADVIRQITENLFSAIFAGGTKASVLMYTCILVYFMLVACVKPCNQIAVKQIRIKALLLGNVIVIVVYSIGLWLTYLFSMHEIEGIYLFGFDRYFGTVLIVVAGVLIYAALSLAGRLGYEKRFVISLLMLFMILAPCTIPKRHFLGVQEYKLPNDYKSDVWRAMEIYIPQNKFYNEDRYAILWDEEDYYDGSRLKGRLIALTETWLRSVNIVDISETEIQAGLSEETLVALSRCDYVACISDMTEHSARFSPYIGDTELGVGFREIKR